MSLIIFRELIYIGPECHFRRTSSVIVQLYFMKIIFKVANLILIEN